MKPVVILLLLLFSQAVFASKDLPIKASAHVNASLMSSPPLATPFQEKKWSLSIRPAYFSVNQEMTDIDPKKLDYDGYAASVFANFPISRSFDFYGLIFGNQLSGDFIGPGANNSTEYPIIAEDVEARTTQLSFGISYDPLAGTSYALPIFFGPGIVFTDLKETVLTNDPLGRDDFDLKMSAQSLMLYGGFQGAVRIKKHFMVGVFAVASQHLDDNDKCQSYSVDVREYGFFFDLSDPACQDGQNSSTSKIEYDLSLFSYGLTLGIPTWGVSLVAFSEVSETEYFEGVQLDMYQITFTL